MPGVTPEGTLGRGSVLYCDAWVQAVLPPGPAARLPSASLAPAALGAAQRASLLAPRRAHHTLGVAALNAAVDSLAPSNFAAHTTHYTTMGGGGNGASSSRPMTEGDAGAESGWAGVGISSWGSEDAGMFAARWGGAR
jgi:hypothetical protein